MSFNYTPKNILKLNLFLILFLLIAHSAGIFSQYVYQRDLIANLTVAFNFDIELNVPTLYSSGLLLICSMILALIAGQHQKRQEVRRPWLALSTIFLFLSMDELLVIHEGLTLPVRSGLGTTGIFYYAWVIPYGIGLLIFAAFFLRFLLKLPRRTAVLFVFSGAIYIGGALGFEAIGGGYSEVYGEANLGYVALSTVEELLEMIGLSVFIYSLLDYVTSQFGSMFITVGNEQVAEES